MPNKPTNHFKKCLLFIFITTEMCGQQNTYLFKSYTPEQRFVVHEWGTFTSLHSSDGKVLTGLQKEEVHLPVDVYNLCFCWNFEKGSFPKGVEITNVTVKMETPVIYFYSPDTTGKKVTVDVKFRNGSISQWYPQRYTGEKNNFIVRDVYKDLPEYNFSKPRTGYISWKLTVLPRKEKKNEGLGCKINQIKTLFC